MVKKCLQIGLAVMLLVSLGGVIGCEVGVYGTYVNQDNPEEYLELRRDGTYYIYEMGIGLTGKWEIKGDEIRFELWGFVVKGRIEGNMIITPGAWGGETIWVKK